ncbi:MAG: FtsX-like permease family protein [Armatimonadetes bacterium]|nr:FtsX-like permease family protein [Armatimonadota bacterium]
MADESKHDEQAAAQTEQAKEALLIGLTAEQRAALLQGDRVDALSEAEIRARLAGNDSGDTLEHEDLVAGMAHELTAQSQVIDLLSEQREPEGLNIAKVLDSATIDLRALMSMRISDRTVDCIGPLADEARRSRIRDEISLPTSKAIEMSVKSVRVRLGRVVITASSIFLGIAFFASVRTTALCLRAAGEATEAGEGARLTWLIIMALLVSVVGICNAMLMAVTERFREIGTMKCLGALDHFIVKLFLIESGVLGLLAGVTGSLSGVVVMYLVNSLRYTFHLTDVIAGFGGILVQGILLGSILSVLAAILPASQAAKMPAAAALRSTV